MDAYPDSPTLDIRTPHRRVSEPAPHSPQVYDPDSDSLSADLSSGPDADASRPVSKGRRATTASCSSAQWSCQPAPLFGEVESTSACDARDLPDHGLDSDDEDVHVVEESAKSALHDLFKDRSEVHHVVTDSLQQIAWRWCRRLFFTCIAMIVLCLPGYLCPMLSQSDCLLFGTASIHYSGFFVLVCAGWILSRIVVVALIVSMVRNKSWGVRATFYVENLSGPLKHVLWAMVVEAAYIIHLFLTPLDNNKLLGPLLRCAVHGFLISAVVFFLEELAIRYFALYFHRNAYLDRLVESLSREYALVLIVKHFAINSLSHVRSDHQLLEAKAEKQVEGLESRDFLKRLFGAKRQSFPFASLAISEKEILNFPKRDNIKFASLVEYYKATEFDVENMCRNLGIHDADLIVKAGDKGKNGKPIKLHQIKDSQFIHSAKLFSNTLFDRLVVTDESVIYEKNFERFMDPELSARSFQMFMGWWNGYVNRVCFYSSIVSLVSDRLVLQRSLHLSEHALKKLNHFVRGITWVLLIAVYVALLGVSVNKVITALTGSIVALTFALGGSIKNLVESIIFLFVTHPFDVGDKILLGKDRLTVEEYNLTSCVFRDTQKHKIWLPNSALFHKPIVNIGRSPDMVDVFALQVGFHTPTHILKQFDAEIGKFLNDHPLHFHPRYMVLWRSIENLNRLCVEVRIKHRGNFQNQYQLRQRRKIIYHFFKEIFGQLEISYHLPPQRVDYEVHKEPLDNEPEKIPSPNAQDPSGLRQRIVTKESNPMK